MRSSNSACITSTLPCNDEAESKAILYLSIAFEVDPGADVRIIYILPSNFCCGALSLEIFTLTCVVQPSTHKALHISQDTVFLATSRVRIFSVVSRLSVKSFMAGIPFGSTLSSLMPKIVTAFGMILRCGLGNEYFMAPR